MEKRTEPNAPLPRLPRYGWSQAPTPGEMPGAAGTGGGAEPSASSGTRAMPMEGAVLYQKAIDNSDVTYRHDPGDRDALRAHVSWGLFVVFLLLLASGPRLWVRHSGYRQAQLAEQAEKLIVIRDQLKVQKGRLEDLRRVAALAEASGLRETEAGRYTWFAPAPADGVTETAVARLFDGRD